MNRLISLVVIFLVMINTTVASAVSLTEAAIQIVAANEQSQVIEGTDGWLFLREELEHIAAGEFWGERSEQASRTAKKQFSDPLPAISAYSQALKEQGIELYVMIVPPKALVYGDKLDPAISTREQAERIYEEFNQNLEDEGVNVIDLFPHLKEMVKAGDERLYCRTDTHFSPSGMLLFAQEAARAVKQHTWFKEYPIAKFSRSTQELTITGDLAKMSGKDVSESIELQLVKGGSSNSFLASDNTSPVILLGDSHTLVYNGGGELHAKGAGLFDNLSAELGFPVDLIGVRGSGANPARIQLYQRARKNPEYLSSKRAVIWCFAARELTGAGGWRIIPTSP